MFLIPFACGVNSWGGATPMQAKWIKLDLVWDSSNSQLVGLPAHDMAFIFFTFLRGVFKSSVFISFKNAIFILKKCNNWRSLFFSKADIWALHIFILQCRLEQIFIFIFMLKVTPSNLPENPQGAPLVNNKTKWLWSFSKYCNLVIIQVNLMECSRKMWLAIAYLFFSEWYCFVVDWRHNGSVPARKISLSCSDWQHLINVWLSCHSSRTHQIKPLHPTPFLFPGLFLCVYIKIPKTKGPAPQDQHPIN